MTSYADRSQVIIALLFGDKLNTEKLSLGLGVGSNLSKLSEFEDISRLPSFSFRLYLTVKLTDKLDIQPEFWPKYSVGFRHLDVYSLDDPDLDQVIQDGKVSRKIHYFAVPVPLQYEILDNFRIEVGPQNSLATRANDFFKSDDLEYKNDIKDDVERFDFGFISGMSYQLMKGKGIRLAARYYQGFVDMIQNEQDSSTSNTVSNFQISAYIPVGK